MPACTSGGRSYAEKRVGSSGGVHGGIGGRSGRGTCSRGPSSRGRRSRPRLRWSTGSRGRGGGSGSAPACRVPAAASGAARLAGRCSGSVAGSFPPRPWRGCSPPWGGRRRAGAGAVPAWARRRRRFGSASPPALSRGGAVSRCRAARSAWTGAAAAPSAAGAAPPCRPCRGRGRRAAAAPAWRRPGPRSSRRLRLPAAAGRSRRLCSAGCSPSLSPRRRCSLCSAAGFAAAGWAGLFSGRRFRVPSLRRASSAVS